MDAWTLGYAVRQFQDSAKLLVPELEAHVSRVRSSNAMRQATEAQGKLTELKTLLESFKQYSFTRD